MLKPEHRMSKSRRRPVPDDAVSLARCACRSSAFCPTHAPHAYAAFASSHRVDREAEVA
jgi:hypothetical protein